LLIQTEFSTEDPGDKPLTEGLTRNQFADALKGLSLAFSAFSGLHGVIVSRPHVHAGDIVSVTKRYAQRSLFLHLPN
jgi:hypothetical protein